MCLYDTVAEQNRGGAVRMRAVQKQGGGAQVAAASAVIEPVATHAEIWTGLASFPSCFWAAG